MDRFDLVDRAAVVTGAGSGIGRATALALAEAGAAVVCADIDVDSAEATASHIADGGRASRGRGVDVSSPDEVEALAEYAVTAHKRLDVWVNVAGIMRYGTVLEIGEAELDAVFAVNFKGVLFGSQSAARRMVEQGSGSIVNVASAILDGPQPRMMAYAASKGAVSMMSRTLALEVGKRGVRVNMVAPGWTRTAMTEVQFTDDAGRVDENAAERVIELQGRMTPLRRTAEPEDTAAAVVYLASDAARFITGQTLRPHGGVTMPW